MEKAEQHRLARGTVVPVHEGGDRRAPGVDSEELDAQLQSSQLLASDEEFRY